MSIPAALLLALGAVVYALTMWDVLKTTLSMHGGGPLTSRLMRGIDWAIARSHDRAPHEPSTGLARYSNLALTVALFVMWFTGLLVAATLMLSSETDAVTQVSEANRGPGWLNTLYFVGASLTTAGFGDFVPNGVYWQLLTMLMAASGLVVSSLGISYVVSIVTAVAAQRALARRITDLGRQPAAILGAYYRDGGFAELGAALQGLSGELITHTQRHLAYPAVHYVRADDDRDCLPAAVALLDETLTVLLYEAPTDALPDRGQLLLLRRAITAYLESLRASFVTEVPEAPPWPDATFLYAEFGMLPEGRTRTLDADGHGRIDLRRGLLLAAVQSQGINWERRWDYLETPEEDRLDGDVVTALARAPAGEPDR